MGTNFYIVNQCWFCGDRKEIHIGKSSAGWKFLLQVNNEYESNVRSLWKFLKWKRIEDEYHRRISRRKLLDLIENKQTGKDNELTNSIDDFGFEWCDREFS